MPWTPPPQPTPFNQKPEDILFLDIETVPAVKEFEELDEALQNLFIRRFDKETIEKGPDKTWREKAALYCEFNKIACVSMGVFAPGENSERTLRLKSFFGYNEAIILQEIMPKLGKAKFLCAHNGKKFDFPLLGRKYIQYSLPIPSILNVAGVKPWESNLFDTLELWQFNDLKSFTSLDTLAYLFGLPSPKSELDGSKVAEVYYGIGFDKTKGNVDDLPWEDKTLQPIAKYCEGDVATLANCYLRMINQAIVKSENIVIA